jgi:hypothetical protein
MQHDYKGCCRSANSSFLWVAAAEALAAWAERNGRHADADARRERASRARSAAEAAYYTAEGYYAPYLASGPAGEPPPPYEDVATKPLWTGYARPDDPRALSSLAYLVGRVGREDGFVVSPLDPVYDDVMDMGVHQGVYTGMSPGYTLYNLALADHPAAGAAFNAVALTASPAGNSAEYQILDDHSALQIIYDSSGTLGDYTARCMSWEGSVVADALVVFLTGFEPDAPSGVARLAPRLPNRWPGMRWTGLRAGEVRFDLEVEDRGDERDVSVTPVPPGVLTVHLDVPLPDVRIDGVRVNGELLDQSDYEVWSPFGLSRLRLPPAEASADEPLLVTVRHSPRAR